MSGLSSEEREPLRRRMEEVIAADFTPCHGLSREWAQQAESTPGFLWG
jgi:hypothetical protein